MTSTLDRGDLPNGKKVDCCPIRHSGGISPWRFKRDYIDGVSGMRLHILEIKW
jgi:hypothetical protein